MQAAQLKKGKRINMADAESEYQLNQHNHNSGKTWKLSEGVRKTKLR